MRPEVLVALITGLVTAGSTLAAVWITNRQNRKMQAAQLRHDAEQRREERQNALRRDVYLDAMAAMAAYTNLLGQSSDLAVSQGEMAATLREHSGNLAKALLVASPGTLRAALEGQHIFAQEYLKLTLRRTHAINLQNQLANTTQALAAPQATPEQAATLLRAHEALRALLPAAQVDLARETVAGVARYWRTATEATIAVRRELGMTTDEAEFRQLVDESLRRTQEDSERFFSALREPPPA